MSVLECETEKFGDRAERLPFVRRRRAPSRAFAALQDGDWCSRKQNRHAELSPLVILNLFQDNKLP